MNKNSLLFKNIHKYSRNLLSDYQHFDIKSTNNSILRNDEVHIVTAIIHLSVIK